MSNEKMKQLETIVEVTSVATDYERTLILAYAQGLNRGMELGKKQAKKEAEEK